MNNTYKCFLPNTKIVGDADANERIHVTLRLKPSYGFNPSMAYSHDMMDKPFATHYSAFASLRNWAAKNSLDVVCSDADRRTFIVGGTVAQFEKLFTTKLYHCHTTDFTYRGRQG